VLPCRPGTSEGRALRRGARAQGLGASRRSVCSHLHRPNVYLRVLAGDVAHVPAPSKGTQTGKATISKDLPGFLMLSDLRRNRNLCICDFLGADSYVAEVVNKPSCGGQRLQTPDAATHGLDNRECSQV